MSLLGLNLKKAGLKVVSNDAKTSHLTFAYNPSELSTEKSAKWNRPTTTSAKSTTKPQFGGSEPQTVSMEIFFDAYEDLLGDVSGDVKTLFEWLKPTSSSLSQGPALPADPRLRMGQQQDPGRLQGLPQARLGEVHDVPRRTARRSGRPPRSASRRCPTSRPARTRPRAA